VRRGLASLPWRTRLHGRQHVDPFAWKAGEGENNTKQLQRLALLFE